MWTDSVTPTYDRFLHFVERRQLCGKKAQQQEKSAAKIDVLASKNTNHVWDEIDSTYSTRLSKWYTGNSTATIQ